jgi:hypothetical protein
VGEIGGGVSVEGLLMEISSKKGSIPIEFFCLSLEVCEVNVHLFHIEKRFYLTRIAFE